MQSSQSLANTFLCASDINVCGYSKFRKSLGAKISVAFSFSLQKDFAKYQKFFTSYHFNHCTLTVTERWAISFSHFAIDNAIRTISFVQTNGDNNFICLRSAFAGPCTFCVYQTPSANRSLGDFLVARIRTRTRLPELVSFVVVVHAVPNGPIAVL